MPTAPNRHISVPAAGIEDLHDEDLHDPIRMWPFNDVGYTMFLMLNFAVGGSGGRDPTTGVLPGGNAGRLGAGVRMAWVERAPVRGA